MFAAINMISTGLAFLLPETRGLALEQMDVVFGAVSQAQRDADVAARVAGAKEGDVVSTHEGEEKDAQLRVEKV